MNTDDQSRHERGREGARSGEPLAGPMDDVCPPLVCMPAAQARPVPSDEYDLSDVAVLGYN